MQTLTTTVTATDTTELKERDEGRIALLLEARPQGYPIFRGTGMMLYLAWWLDMWDAGGFKECLNEVPPGSGSWWQDELRRVAEIL